MNYIEEVKKELNRILDKRLLRDVDRALRSKEG